MHFLAPVESNWFLYPLYPFTWGLLYLPYRLIAPWQAEVTVLYLIRKVKVMDLKMGHSPSNQFCSQGQVRTPPWITRIPFPGQEPAVVTRTWPFPRLSRAYLGMLPSYSNYLSTHLLIHTINKYSLGITYLLPCESLEMISGNKMVTSLVLLLRFPWISPPNGFSPQTIPASHGPSHPQKPMTYTNRACLLFSVQRLFLYL